MNKNLAKVLGTAAVWGGICGLCWMFNSFDILSGKGAGLMVFVGLLQSASIWHSK
ncbi:hypothetical protein KKA27_04270 [Patescibacteria group bacterium]|nr:hypothetical protein [Patescibacteria group bacterium]